MLSNATQEPAYLAQLRGITQRLDTVDERLAQLVVHEDDGRDVVAPLATAWQDFPERPGVRLFHVPRPDGKAGLYLAACEIAPGTAYAGSHIDQSQLIAVLEGDIFCKDRWVRPGEFLYLAPGEPSAWRVGPGGYLAVIRYDVPPHDVDPALLSIS